MSDEAKARAAIQRMGKRLREGHAQAGQPISQERAEKQARDIAKRVNRKYDR